MKIHNVLRDIGTLVSYRTAKFIENMDEETGRLILQLKDSEIRIEKLEEANSMLVHSLKSIEATATNGYEKYRG